MGKGAIIDMYIGTKVYNLDPAIAYTDESTAKILSLVFEGLMEINENGKLEKALMRDYELEEVELDDGTTRWEMKIRINTTYWSDGSLVQTNDLIYAWKRILDPTFDSPAAALLFAIDGAYERKQGEISEDDIGIYSTAKDKMVVQFEENVTKEMIDEFLYNLASLALVPVRETKVKTYPDTWSKRSSDLSTNGPFKVKKFTGTPGEEIVLERSAYYYLSQETDNEAIDKYVTPYRLVFHYVEPLDRTVVYSKNAKTDIIGMLADNALFYAGNLHGAVLANFKASDIEYNDVASTYAYYFNTSSEIGANASVRYALSIAIDREAIAKELNNGSKAATGLIPSMIFDTKKGNSFRKEGGDILPSKANVAEAERILSDAGVNVANFETIYLYYIKDATNDSYQSSEWGYESKEKLVAMHTKAAWEALGFKVVIKGVTAEEHANIYATGKYDVIGLDYQMVSAYALANLTPFAKAYSGRVLEEDTGAELVYTQLTHVSGYYNAEYDALIKTAVEAKTQKARSEALHAAEEMLLKDAAVVPVLFNSEAYVSSALSDIETNFWGCNTFTKTYLNNYVEHNTAANGDTSETGAGK
jgi:ABC-type oligopeptide transport system substrate-binding subunit